MIEPGVYKHYAGGLYYVLTTARHTETDEWLVIYFPLYTHENGGVVIQARPAKMWTEDVGGVPRFIFIGEVLPPKARSVPMSF